MTLSFALECPAHSPARLAALRLTNSAKLSSIEDAQVLTTLILRMEYHALVDGVENLDMPGQRAVLKRFLDLVIGL